MEARVVSHDSDIQRFWRAYASAEHLPVSTYTVFRFGDSDELADKLVRLVLAGKKRATTSLLRDFTAADEPLPRPGDYGVVVDAHNAPRCVVRTTEVSVKLIRDVDDDFAQDEGGGDCSLSWWQSSHVRYFRRQGAREGFVFDDNSQVVLVRFELVWPRKPVQHASWI
jgi:uncharacterized protein YhfF